MVISVFCNKCKSEFIKVYYLIEPCETVWARYDKDDEFIGIMCPKCYVAYKQKNNKKGVGGCNIC